MFLNLKYPETGTMSNASQWFVKAPITGPRLLLFPLLSKAAFGGIYMASIVPSFLHFPCFTPVSVPKRVLLTAKGDFRRPRPTLPGLCANISASVSFDISVSVLLDIVFP